MTNGAVVNNKGDYQYKTAEELTSVELNKVLIPIKTQATKDAKAELLLKDFLMLSTSKFCATETLDISIRIKRTIIVKIDFIRKFQFD